MKKLNVLRTFPEHGSCFVCGSKNPGNMGVRWHVLEDRSIFAEVTLSLAQQGPPGHAHGGASAALLDEAMGCAVWAAGHQVVAVELKVNYHKPIPLNQAIKVTGRIKQQEGHALFTQGEIRLPDDTIAVTGAGVYVEAPQMFDEMLAEIRKS